jgi:uncharacterized membrane protein
MGHFRLPPVASLLLLWTIMVTFVTLRPKPAKKGRVESIDFLRGSVMIIMALDHVRDYFHNEAFLFSPTDLSRTNGILFFTRFITHYCAPVFIFLAGISARLYGMKRSRKELSFFLFSRGVWLVFVELFILSLFRTFNPSYPFFNLQVIWAIGICMIVLSALVYLSRRQILLIGLVLIVAHNLLDPLQVSGKGVGAFLWSVLHQPGSFHLGHFTISVKYPVMPWIGLMAVGYYFGDWYTPGCDPVRRRLLLFLLGYSTVAVFFILRIINGYGDAARWSVQKNPFFTLLSFLNVTKYPPSLLYILITIGPALLFLAFMEGPLNRWKSMVVVFGRVAMFYYLVHILLIHLFALLAAVISGYKASDMVLSSGVDDSPGLKGYGFDLWVVYGVWIVLILLLYPLCKWFDRYKRAHQATQWWLSYL